MEVRLTVPWHTRLSGALTTSPGGGGAGGDILKHEAGECYSEGQFTAGWKRVPEEKSALRFPHQGSAATKQRRQPHAARVLHHQLIFILAPAPHLAADW